MDNWVIVLFSLIFSAFFSGMEIAFVSANRLKIELDREKGSVGGRIFAKLNRKPGRFIGALLLGNNISLVVYGIAMTAILEPAIRDFLPEIFQGEFAALVLQTIIATVLILFAAEFLPKILFKISPNAILNFFAVPVYFFYSLFYPLVFVFIGFAEWLLKRLFRIRFSNNDYRFGVVDLDHYIKEFSPDDNVEDENLSGLKIIQNVIDFKEVKVRECMVPRTEVVALEDDIEIAVLLQTFHTTGHTKILIYNESVDNIIGYAHAYDMFKNPKTVSEILHPVLIVPETMPAKDMLQQFIKQHRSLSVVVDEFGGTAGIVTMEDIIEEIFGEINDEYDIDDQAEKKISETEYVFSARLEIDYLNEKYRFTVPDSDEYETLAGLIITHHQDIPNLHDVIQIEGFIFTIVAKEDNRIDMVKLNLLNLQNNSGV